MDTMEASVTSRDSGPSLATAGGVSLPLECLAWAVGLLELFLFLSVALCLLIWPPIFDKTYRALGVSAHPRDAATVVRWLSSSDRERSLNLALTEGQAGPKELHHYSDVRRLFRWFPRLALGAAAGLALVLVSGQASRGLLAAAQWRGFWIYAGLMIVLGGLAWWDWKLFFAWLHHPFFGDTSWRLPKGSYSLQLFPTSFWRRATAGVLLAPALGFGAVAAVIFLGPGARVNSNLVKSGDARSRSSG
jgi:hypothetical protein